MNNAKFLRTPILKNICERLLLNGKDENQNLTFQVDLFQKTCLDMDMISKVKLTEKGIIRKKSMQLVSKKKHHCKKIYGLLLVEATIHGCCT